MKTNSLLFLCCAVVGAGCAATIPPELASARRAYQHASASPAAQLTPAELHKAHEALMQAEQSFAGDPDSYQTRDLSYVAERKSQMAEALASIASESASASKSNSEYQATQSGLVQSTRTELNATRNALDSSQRAGDKSRSDLAASEKNGQKTAADLAAEKQGRADAEQRATDAQDALAKLAAVKQEDRGLVITLSGSVLFPSDQSTLLPEAQARLGQVADALLANRQRKATVEGHTDSRGSDSHNLDLSQRRADAVRSFIVSRGYDATLISAVGIGKGRPVADNGTAEGRANNRRVEIIIAPREVIGSN